MAPFKDLSSDQVEDGEQVHQSSVILSESMIRKEYSEVNDWSQSKPLNALSMYSEQASGLQRSLANIQPPEPTP